MSPILKSELLVMIARGEGATLEFKDDRIHPKDLSKSIVAFANMNGGRILLGVADSGEIVGIPRENLQEWLMDTVIGSHVHPFILPEYEEIELDGKRVAVVTVPRGPAKPYVRRHNKREDIYVRYGATNQIAGREQAARLFGAGGLLESEKFPINGTSVEDLDKRRYSEFFQNILQEPQRENWRQMLVDWGFLVGDGEAYCCSYFAHALFAKQPGIKFPFASVRVTVYAGSDKDYGTVHDASLDAPIVEYRGEDASRLVEPALHDRIIERIQPHISEEKLVGTTRKRILHYPLEVIREVLINALVHRDWTRNNHVRIVVYGDRMEVTSPGGLPNGMTIEKIKNGVQSVRNPNCARVMRGYGYLEDQGMGIRRKVIPLMEKENGTTPEFSSTEDSFTVILRKAGE
ncbi:MAG: putative DNA binding domain-containing protein [Alphaproteobacteria bacterium]|nr:putative DNA binding domain-containing protein [Alphaproteobacteria bacterium]